MLRGFIDRPKSDLGWRWPRFAQQSNREFRELPKVEDIRPTALLRRQRMSIAAASKEGIFPTVGMRALPRVRLDSMILSLFVSVGISLNGESIAMRSISASCIIGMLSRLISDIQRPRSLCARVVCEACLPACYHRHSAFLGRNVRLSGVDNI